MNNGRTQIEYLDEKLYMIGTISKLIGAGAITLRAWKRQHRLIQPVRKDSGHLLNTRSHIDQINRDQSYNRADTARQYCGIVFSVITTLEEVVIPGEFQCCTGATA